MAWEPRRGRGRYYTRSRREGGRVVREYVGSGEVAEAIATLEGLDAGRRDLKRAEEASEKAEARQAQAALRELCEQAEALAQAALVLAGYHRHHRGEWRKRRDGTC